MALTMYMLRVGSEETRDLVGLAQVPIGWELVMGHTLGFRYFPMLYQLSIWFKLT